MPRATHAVAGLLIAAAFASPALSQEVSAQTVVATVNGTEITVGHLILMRRNLPQQYQALPDEVLFDAMMDQAINQTVLAQTVSAPPLSVRLQLENERRALLAGAAIQTLVSEALTEEAIRTAYEERFANAAPETEYNAAHILVATEEEALELIEALEGGADFAELARERSTGPSGPNGGALGWFGTGMMVKPFEDAVRALEPGQISPPVQTQFGWHVIRLNETRLKDAPPLEEVRGEIIDELQADILRRLLDDLTGKADIRRLEVPGFGPETLRNDALLED